MRWYTWTLPLVSFITFTETLLFIYLSPCKDVYVYTPSVPARRIALLSVALPPQKIADFPLFMLSRNCLRRNFNYSLHIMNNCTYKAGRRSLDGSVCKLELVSQLFDSNIEWFLVSDIDFTITSFDRPLDHWIPEGDYHLVLPSEHETKPYFSAFILLIRNSLWGRRFINFVKQDLETNCWLWSEQGSIFKSIFYLFNEYRALNLTEDQMCRKVCDHGPLLSCIDSLGNKLRFGPQFRQRPPVYWTPFDGEGFPALGIQAKQASEHHFNEINPATISAVRNSLGVHATPDKAFHRDFLVPRFDKETCRIKWKD